MRVGIDVGGTFTDLVLWDGERLHTTKTATTPDAQDDGVVEALRRVGASEASLVHGTTVATNALLERSGARTVLVADDGFEDLIEIGRQDRPSLYDTAAVRPDPLVPPERRIGVPGRDRVLDEGELADLVSVVGDLDPESVAVSCLFSYADPARESSIHEALERSIPVPISRSSFVVPEFREYERTSTTAINAYLVPMVEGYLRRLEDRVASVGVVDDVRVMRSSGGLIDLAGAAELPASIVLSGPAGGVVAAAALGRAMGYDDLVSFDMGGTSTDVCRIAGGRPEVGFEQAVGGVPNRMPSVAVHTVGAGGGSIGWVDAGGALRVGPSSAGAVPGPAAYGRGGTEPTVTDADLAIGRLGHGAPLGQSLALDAELSRRALERLGEGLGLAPFEVALGMVEVVEAVMERAVRVVSIEQGADPRDAFLVAFGGAGGLHASSLAKRLGMAGVIIPPHAGVFSALGLLLAPPRADVVIGSVMLGGDHRLQGLIESAGATAVQRLGFQPESVEFFVDLRYRGQSHELSIPTGPRLVWSDLSSDFHREHEERFGFARPEDPLEIVAVRSAALGRSALTMESFPAHRAQGDADRGHRVVRLADSETDARVWWRPALAVGREIVGPAVIEEPEATTYIGRGERAIVDDSGSLEVSW